VTAGTVLVLGGARAGKSAWAVTRARSLGERVAVVATAEPRDGEMVARIARHRAERPPGWATIEAPVELAAALTDLAGKVDVVVVDCLTVWVANLLDRTPEAADAALLDQAAHLADVLARRAFHVVVVSNEVGWGVHPETAIGLRFRDLLGRVNQAVAAVADEVVLLVAGCPVVIKGVAR
jgi:adenosylcobinamide kinase / adenosylcobinamide-phosphate guanylyltransferase